MSLDELLGNLEEHKANYFRERNESRLGRFYQFWCRQKVEGLGKLPGGYAVILAHHSSRIDIPAIMNSTDEYLRFYARPKLEILSTFITKKRRFSWARLRPRFDKVGVRTLELDVLRNLKQIVAYDIKSETKMVVLPEGRTSDSYEIREPKEGVIKAVLENRPDALFIPAVVIYRPDWTNWQPRAVTKNLALPRTKVIVSYGTPLAARSHPSDEELGYAVKDLCYRWAQAVSEMSKKRINPGFETKIRRDLALVFYLLLFAFIILDCPV